MNPVPFTTLAAAMDFVVGDRNYPLSELFMKGGFIMWPLLLLSIAGVVVLVMCCFSTRASAVLPTKLVEQAESFIRKRDYTGLSILCKDGDSCYARVMLTVASFMLRNPSAQFEEVREIAAAEGGRQAGFLSRQISWLSDIGALAPMLGLLGTVVGMMKTFFEIANGDFSGGKQRIDMAGRRGGSPDYDRGRPDAGDPRHPGLCVLPQPRSQARGGPGSRRDAQRFRSSHPAPEAACRRSRSLP